MCWKTGWQISRLPESARYNKKSSAGSRLKSWVILINSGHASSRIIPYMYLSARYLCPRRQSKVKVKQAHLQRVFLLIKSRLTDLQISPNLTKCRATSTERFILLLLGRDLGSSSRTHLSFSVPSPMPIFRMTLLDNPPHGSDCWTSFRTFNLCYCLERGSLLLSWCLSEIWDSSDMLLASVSFFRLY